MAAPVDIKTGSRRRCFDDDAGALYLGNDDDNVQDRHKIDFNKRSLGKFESNLELENKIVKEQHVAGSSMRTMVSGNSEVCEAGDSCQQQKRISGTRDELEMRSSDRFFLTNDDEDDETDSTSYTHQFFPLQNLQNSTDVLEDEADLLSGVATCCLKGEKDGVLLNPRRASFNVSFQRTSLHRSQTCPAITSTFARSQVVAIDDSQTSVVLPTGFSQMWFRALPRTSDKNYGSSQKARQSRSYSFSHEKDVHYQQQQQQQHYVHQQILQQQRTMTVGRRSLPKRDRSYSESDVRWLELREMGRELRRMSDEFASDRSRRSLMTVREEDEDSSVGSHYSSSYPETVGIHHWFM